MTHLGAPQGPAVRQPAGRPGAGRLGRLGAGLALFATGLWLGLRAHLGVGPWDVLTGGLARQLHTSFGATSIGVSVAVLLVGLACRIRPGLGTVANVLVVGVLLDLLLGGSWLSGLPGAALWLRVLALLAGIAVVAAGSALYLGARLGAGPRDGLMVALVTRTGWPIGACRALLEGSVLVVGAALRGPVGPGTVVFAVGIGPAVQLAFRVLRQSPVAPTEEAILEY